ncbi:hypothetical protein BH09ACT9_BH09ACT9_45880 [soil metagenome]
MSADLGDGASPVIEEVTDDSGLRWMGRLFASTISGVTPQSVGTIAAQHEHDPDWVRDCKNNGVTLKGDTPL